MIHPTAIIHPGARLGEGVSVGAYSLIGEHVEIGDNTWVGPHVVISGHTRIGCDNNLFQFSIAFITPESLVTKAASIMLGIGVYGVFLLLLGVIGKGELALLWSVVRRSAK